MAWVETTDYRHPAGWLEPARADERARENCRQLEEGQILFLNGIPFDLPREDRQVLLGLRQTGSRLHKNISYRPQQDILKGIADDGAVDDEVLHRIMRNYSQGVTQFLTRFLAPYAGRWIMDFASFRPIQEQGRDLPLHKRNDLLHVDAFPTRPTHGGRILRVFTNLNPSETRVWRTAVRFPELARQYAMDAGLGRVAGGASSPLRAVSKGLQRAARVPGADRSPYDEFMLRFHDWLKENREFQERADNARVEFPPLTTWLVFTDGVPHAALSGQYALEQTYIIPPDALVAPEQAPIRVLEQLCGRTLA